MAKTAAAVVINKVQVFSVLGDVTVVDHVFDTLKTVRGIDRIVCVVSRRLVERTQSILGGRAVELLAVQPDLIGDRDKLEKWLLGAGGPCSDVAALAIMESTVPFLPAVKIELLVDLVQRSIADTAFTSREGLAYLPHGRVKCQTEVPGCRVVSARPGKRFRHVEVNAIEALDIADAGNHRLAIAAFEAGLLQ